MLPSCSPYCLPDETDIASPLAMPYMLQVRDGMRILRYMDGIELGHKGPLSATRGHIVLTHFM